MDGYRGGRKLMRKRQRLRVTAEQPAGRDKQLRVSRVKRSEFLLARRCRRRRRDVMQEDVTRNGDEIVINTDLEAGEFVRRRGCDLSEGQRILAKGRRLPWQRLLCWRRKALVIYRRRQVNAAILSTGDELVESRGRNLISQNLREQFALLGALLHRCGAAVNLVEHCRDERESVAQGDQARDQKITFSLSPAAFLWESTTW